MNDMMQRRATFLAGAAAACGLAGTPLLAGSQTASADTFRTRRIDVHHHFIPPAYAEAAGARLVAQAPDFARVLTWKPQQSLAEMDQRGVASAVVSLSTPSVYAGDAAAARALARQCNEFAAGMSRDHPKRFGWFATLPLPDIDGTLAEIAYCLDVLKADGIGFLSSYGDKWLGDPAFAPIFDELHRRKSIAYVHPTVANCCKALIPGIVPAVDEFLFDTTRTITALLYSGTFSRCSDVTFIFAQDGGVLPMIAERIARSTTPAIAARLPHGANYELKRLHFDCATSASPLQLRALLDLCPLENVMLGSDFPFLPIGMTTGQLDGAGLSAAQQGAINRTNALALLPRFA